MLKGRIFMYYYPINYVHKYITKNLKICTKYVISNLQRDFTGVFKMLLCTGNLKGKKNN